MAKPTKRAPKKKAPKKKAPKKKAPKRKATERVPELDAVKRALARVPADVWHAASPGDELAALDEAVRAARRKGLKPALDTEVGDLDISGFTVTAEITRRLRFGRHPFAEWTFDLVGETGQYITGFFLTRDFEDPAVPLDWLERMGLDPDDFPGFPGDWWEALAMAGIDAEELEEASSGEDGEDE